MPSGGLKHASTCKSGFKACGSWHSALFVSATVHIILLGFQVDIRNSLARCLPCWLGTKNVRSQELCLKPRVSIQLLQDTCCMIAKNQTAAATSSCTMASISHPVSPPSAKWSAWGLGTMLKLDETKASLPPIYIMYHIDTCGNPKCFLLYCTLSIYRSTANSIKMHWIWSHFFPVKHIDWFGTEWDWAIQIIREILSYVSLYISQCCMFVTEDILYSKKQF